MPKSKTYEEFVEKFKPKRTTDDCYTPANVYETVKNWVINEYNLKNVSIERPFYPGGDYQNYEYKANSVVIDNPPFSILTQIIRWYEKKGIKYFLFSPALTMFRRGIRGYIITDSEIVYENGASVSTSFTSNLESALIRSAPDLKKALEEVQKKEQLPRYKYPKNLVTSGTLGKYSRADFRIENGFFIRELESQKKLKKSIYGAGFLISDDDVKQLIHIKKEKETGREFVWDLSEEEQKIIDELNRCKK